MNNELYHHGILGQKWGIRRYQNKDGSLTPAGKKRYGIIEDAKMTAKKYSDKLQKEADRIRSEGTVGGRKLADYSRDYLASQMAKNSKIYENAYNTLKDIPINEISRKHIKMAKNFMKNYDWSDRILYAVDFKND